MSIKNFSQNSYIHQKGHQSGHVSQKVSHNSHVTHVLVTHTNIPHTNKSDDSPNILTHKLSVTLPSLSQILTNPPYIEHQSRSSPLIKHVTLPSLTQQLPR